MKTETIIAIGLGSAGLLALGGWLLLGRGEGRKERPRDGKKEEGREAKASALVQPDWEGAFDQGYVEDVKAWLAPKRIAETDSKTLSALARRIRDAKGGSWYEDDDEQEVEEVFGRLLRDKVAVSGLSRAFWEAYREDLWEYLSGFLSGSEMERHVSKHVRRLPAYRIKT